MINKSDFTKNSKKHLYVWFMAFVLVLVVSCLFISISFAKFTAFGSGTRYWGVSGFGTVKLVEYDGETANVLSANSQTTFTITPNVDITRRIEVNYTSDENTKVPAYVFISVNAKNWVYTNASKTFSIQRESENLVSFVIDDGWTFVSNTVDGENIETVFYKEVAALNNLTENVIKNNLIDVSAKFSQQDIDRIQSLDVSLKFNAQAIQKNESISVLETWNNHHN